jgi:hypothetical protein
MAWVGTSVAWEGSSMAWEATSIACESTSMTWEGTSMSAKCLPRRILRGFSRFGSKPRPSVVKKRQSNPLYTPSGCPKGASTSSPRLPRWSRLPWVRVERRPYPERVASGWRDRPESLQDSGFS